MYPCNLLLGGNSGQEIHKLLGIFQFFSAIYLFRYLIQILNTWIEKNFTVTELGMFDSPRIIDSKSDHENRFFLKIGSKESILQELI